MVLALLFILFAATAFFISASAGRALFGIAGLFSFGICAGGFLASFDFAVASHCRACAHHCCHKCRYDHEFHRVSLVVSSLYLNSATLAVQALFLRGHRTRHWTLFGCESRVPDL